MNNYFMETHHHEWILSNNKGGYALGTGNLINQRKYHGLLIAGIQNERHIHLVSGLEEKVEWRGETFHLDSNNYSNCIYPEGFLYLVKSWLRPYPIFLYSALPHQNDILIRKEIFMDEITNTVLVKYTNLSKHKLHFEFHPKFTMIDHHQVNQPGSLDQETFETDITFQNNGYLFMTKRPSNNTELYGYSQKGEVINNRYTYYNVFYPWDEMKGYSGISDQITLFELRFELGVGEENYIIFSDELSDSYAKKSLDITRRYKQLPLPHDYPVILEENNDLLHKLDYGDNLLFDYDEYLDILDLALSDFMLTDNIITGYPWYGIRSTDAMLVTEALLDSAKHIAMAEAIIKKYNLLLINNLLPFYPLNSNGTLEISVEASLRFVTNIYKLGKIKQKRPYWLQCIKSTEDILKSICNNTIYPFSLRDDFLLELDMEYSHMTWMNAKTDGMAITPRHGIPVEINALLYNALCLYEEMCGIYNNSRGKKYEASTKLLNIKSKLQSSFQKFWLGDYLADRIVHNELIDELRPNAVIAGSLPNTPLTNEQLFLIWDKAYKKLYTNYGLRTLDPDDVKFRKKYYGNYREREQSYHNGTVWAWLLKPFCDLYLKIHSVDKSKQDIAQNLADFISSFRNGFMRGHICSVAEIWDGDSPHFPKGVPAMARSVAALYSIEHMIKLLKEEN